jgi:hypothetical protein
MPPPADPPTGARITGVDDKTYSSTGEAFSTILLPHAESTAAKKLQADDVSLAYEVRATSQLGHSMRPTNLVLCMLTPFLCFIPIHSSPRSSRGTLVRISRSVASTVSTLT